MDDNSGTGSGHRKTRLHCVVESFKCHKLLMTYVLKYIPWYEVFAPLLGYLLHLTLVFNSNCGPILHRFWDTASYWLKIVNFSYLTLVWRPHSGGIPSEFLNETYRSKTRGMGLLYGENCMTLTSAIFDWSTRVTDRQTDRRNCDSICALSIYAVARKK